MSDSTWVRLTLLACDYHNNSDLILNCQDVLSGPTQFTVGEVGLTRIEFEDVGNGELTIEAELEKRCVPYDKKWGNGDEFNCGETSLRVLSDGRRVLKQTSNTIDLHEAIKAFKNNTIAAFLERERDAKIAIDWAVQEAIINNRKKTHEALSSVSDVHLDNLVTEMHCLLSSDLHSSSNDDEQETAIYLAEKQASKLNNNGREAQIEYLLNNGYLASECHKVTQKHEPMQRPSNRNNFMIGKYLNSNERICGYMDLNEIGIEIHISGYSDYCSNDDNGTPIYITQSDNGLEVVVYGDINQEEPTHIIPLNGAKCSNRMD